MAPRQPMGFLNQRGLHLAKPRPSDYVRDNIMITTSGVSDHTPLLGGLRALGADRIMFSTDCRPLASSPAAAT
ncbi:hypothetical protein [Streptomyces thinghirensis]|uniref:Uncharacterized protein n=1 Tax=Streptomyces thinghirensis TaxID=551547 RepID=A0ABP9SZS9_9ACTN